MSWASPGSLDSQVHHGLVKGELGGGGLGPLDLGECPERGAQPLSVGGERSPQSQTGLCRDARL